MSENALIELEKACDQIEGNPELFDQTIQAVRDALRAGLKVVFLTGAFALLLALLFILTIPEVSMDVEVKDKNPGG